MTAPIGTNLPNATPGQYQGAVSLLPGATGAPPPVNPVAILLSQLARFPTLDPRAVLAVSKQEGLRGGIGDNGTSFGPFQLHYGGAYPSYAPQGAPASQAWAWSPQGIDYALRQIAGVAGGLRGGPAVANIVQRFERPANPTAETQNALAAYGGINAAQYPALTVNAGGAAPGPSPVAAQLGGPAATGGQSQASTRARETLRLALQILNS